MDFPGQDKRAIFEPDRIEIEKVDGTLIEARDNPDKSFAGQQRETPWDDIHVTYFVGEAFGRTSTPRSSTLTKDLPPRKSRPSRSRAKPGDA